MLPLHAGDRSLLLSSAVAPSGIYAAAAVVVEVPGTEYGVDSAGVGELAEVAGEVGGVGGEVLGGGELAGVDVDGDGDEVGEGAGALDEGEVAGVEEAHGRDQG